MAERAAVLTNQTDGMLRVTWEGITEADQGAAVEIGPWPDKTVQAIGDFDASGAITMEGSNDGSAWFTLTSHAGDDIVLTAATMGFLIAENPRYIRPRATAGSSVDMDVIIVGAPRQS